MGDGRRVWVMGGGCGEGVGDGRRVWGGCG